MKGKYLITTDNWFVAPDGSQYKAVYGECVVMADDVLGVKTNAKSTNWFVRVGDESNHIVIAGCQIHYAVKCERLNLEAAYSFCEKDGKVTEYKTPTRIYSFA